MSGMPNFRVVPRLRVKSCLFEIVDEYVVKYERRTPTNPIKRKFFDLLHWCNVKFGLVYQVKKAPKPLYELKDYAISLNDVMHLLDSVHNQFGRRVSVILVGRTAQQQLIGEVYEHSYLIFNSPDNALSQLYGATIVCVPWMEGILPLTNEMVNELKS